jgi:hypothetical protein
MIERFLFDRVDAKARRAAIGREHDLGALPGAHEAETALPFLRFAITGAEVALNWAIRHDVAPGFPSTCTRPNFEEHTKKW